MLFKTMIRTPASTGLLAMATGALALVAMTGSSHALVLTETNTLNVLIDYTSVTDTINITGGGTVLGLTVTIDFTKCGETFTGPTCTDPGRPYYGEIDFKLKNGTTTIDLVQGSNLVGTYAWQTSGPGVRAIVTFDDAAADLVGSTNGGIPEDGTFQPIGSLASFLGFNAAGAWELIMADEESPDPLWVAIAVHAAKTVLGKGIALLGGLAVPLDRFDIDNWNTSTEIIHETEAVLGGGIAPLGGHAEPLHC